MLQILALSCSDRFLFKAVAPVPPIRIQRCSTVEWRGKRNLQSARHFIKERLRISHLCQVFSQTNYSIIKKYNLCSTVLLIGTDSGRARKVPLEQLS